MVKVMDESNFDHPYLKHKDSDSWVPYYFGILFIASKEKDQWYF